MSKWIECRLVSLQEDYRKVTGQPFDHFFCPILHTDEAGIELCKGHVVNEAFPNTSRQSVVQRKDVDGFYGRIFESDFVDIQYFEKSALDVLTNKSLSRRLNSKIIVNEKITKHFAAKNVPEGFTALEFDIDGQKTLFGVENPEADLIDSTLEVEWGKDLRLASLVSLIKAAHLTLFYLLGYTYALSPMGRYIGYDILGRFYLENYLEKSKDIVISNSVKFFDRYKHMVRAVESNTANLQGSINDNIVLFCRRKSGSVWGNVVFVKADKTLHAVLIPVIGETQSLNQTFDSFLSDDQESIEVSQFQLQNGAWNMRSNNYVLQWPKSDASVSLNVIK